jgi:hypothetical protein
MSYLHNVLTLGNFDPAIGPFNPALKYLTDATKRPPGAPVIPMPDPVALAQAQRIAIARQAAGGEGRAATILSPQPTSDKLGP